MTMLVATPPPAPPRSDNEMTGPPERPEPFAGEARNPWACIAERFFKPREGRCAPQPLTKSGKSNIIELAR